MSVSEEGHVANAHAHGRLRVVSLFQEAVGIFGLDGNLRQGYPVDAGRHAVVYSDLDNNGHANNGRYPHWAIDALPPELPTRGTVRDFCINYNREVRLGDTLEMLRATDGQGTWYVEGRHGNAQSFICKIVFG